MRKKRPVIIDVTDYRVVGEKPPHWFGSWWGVFWFLAAFVLPVLLQLHHRHEWPFSGG